jgi:hypothetical protein
MRKFCPQCKRSRAFKHFIGDSDTCSDCCFSGLVQSEYRKCNRCTAWKPTFAGYHCADCKIHCSKLHKLRGSKNTFVCSVCEIEKHSRGFPIADKTTCFKCHHILSAEKNGLRKCYGCKGYREASTFHLNICKGCKEKRTRQRKARWQRLKNCPVERERLRVKSLDYWKRHKEERKVYRKYFYWNIHKPRYNKALMILWEKGLVKERKVNRNGYWYTLNKQIFKKYGYKSTSAIIKAVLFNERKNGVGSYNPLAGMIRDI